MKKLGLFLFLMMAGFCSLEAQTAEDSVKAAVNAMFEAMKIGDAIALKNCFSDSAILQTIATNKSGQKICQDRASFGICGVSCKTTQGCGR